LSGIAFPLEVYQAIAERGDRQGAEMDWARILAYVTGSLDHERMAQNKYLTAENRILIRRNGRLKLSDARAGRARQYRSSADPQGSAVQT
jgi:hypothetical protein